MCSHGVSSSSPSQSQLTEEPPGPGASAACVTGPGGPSLQGGMGLPGGGPSLHRSPEKGGALLKVTQPVGGQTNTETEDLPSQKSSLVT